MARKSSWTLSQSQCNLSNKSRNWWFSSFKSSGIRGGNFSVGSWDEGAGDKGKFSPAGELG